MIDTDRAQTARHVSSFHIELVRLGVASPSERAWIDEHLHSCPACGQMADAFEASRLAFAGAVAARSGAELRARLARVRRRRWRWLGAGLLIPVATSFLAVVSWRSPQAPAGPDIDPDIAVKSGAGPGLLVAVRRGDRVFPVQPGEPLRPGDQIRFVLERARHPFVMIASVDGAGQASIYVPFDGKESLAIGTNRREDRVELPGSIIVDDSPGPERLFALLSRRPIDAASVRAALSKVGAGGSSSIRSTNRLDVGAADQVSVLVEKAIP
jgi:hypothetical protein